MAKTKLSLATLVCVILLSVVGWRPAAVQAAAESPRAIFASLYGDEIKRVSATRDTKDDVALAKNLLKAVETAKDQAELVEVFCDNAYLLASRDSTADGYDTAISAMQTLAKYVPDKAMETSEKIYATLRSRFMRSTGDEKATAGESLIDHHLAAAKRFIDSSDYKGAAREYQRAQVIARQIQSPRLSQIDAKREEANEREETARRISLLQERISEDASNAALRKELVLIYVVEMDDPAAAMPHAGATGDDELKRLVPLAAKGNAAPTDASLDLGDWYFRLSSEASNDSVKRRLLQHASKHLSRFLNDSANASGIQKAKATLTLNRVKTTLDKLKPTSVATNTNTNSNTNVRPPTHPAKVDKPGKLIDALKLVSASQDTATGKWEATGRKVGSVVEGDYSSAWLNLPVQPSDEYEVRFKFVKTAGRAVVKVYLPLPFVDSSSSSYTEGVCATFGATDGKFSMLERGTGTSYYYTYYDETNYKNNPTLQGAVRLTNGKPYSFRITVKKDDDLPVITVYISGKKFIAWKGKPSALPGYHSSSTKVDRKTIGLGVYNPVQRSTAVFTSFSIKSLSGTVKTLRDK